MSDLDGLGSILTSIQDYKSGQKEFSNCLSKIRDKVERVSKDIRLHSPGVTIADDDIELLEKTRRVLTSLTKVKPDESTKIRKANTAIQEILDSCVEEVSLASTSETLPPIRTRSTGRMPSTLDSSGVIPRPKQSNVMNQKELKRWISAHPRSVRNAVEAAVSKVRHVGQEEFEASSGRCADHLVKELTESGKIDDFQFSVLGREGKSNKWVYMLVEHRLPETLKPQSFLDAKICTGGDSPEVPENIVIFDDATYSGEQLSRIIRQIKSQVSNVQEVFPDKEIPFPKVWICIPFMTNKGEENVREALENSWMDFFIADHDRIDTIQELFESEPETLEKLDSMWGFSLSDVQSGTKDVPPSIIRHLAARAESQGLIYFDHKVGDDLSFPKALAEGVVLDKNKKELKKGFKIIPETRPPYKSFLPKRE